MEYLNKKYDIRRVGNVRRVTETIPVIESKNRVNDLIREIS